jgi:hypothetical protein
LVAFTIETATYDGTLDAAMQEGTLSPLYGQQVFGHRLVEAVEIARLALVVTGRKLG